MTKAKSIITKPLISKPERQLTVRESYYEYQSKQHPKQRVTIGQILIKGHWLIQAGFLVNSSVTIHIERGKLVLTAESC